MSPLKFEAIGRFSAFGLEDFLEIRLYESKLYELKLYEMKLYESKLYEMLLSRYYTYSRRKSYWCTQKNLFVGHNF